MKLCGDRWNWTTFWKETFNVFTMHTMYEKVVSVIEKPVEERTDIECTDLISWFRNKSSLFRSLKAGKRAHAHVLHKGIDLYKTRRKHNNEWCTSSREKGYIKQNLFSFFFSFVKRTKWFLCSIRLWNNRTDKKELLKQVTNVYRTSWQLALCGILLVWRNAFGHGFFF